MAERESVKRQHYNDKNPTTLREILETDTLASMVRFHLGMRKQQKRDNQGNVTEEEWIVTDHALLNEHGIESMVGFIRSIVDKNQTMSVYQAQEIRNIMQDLHETISRDLYMNWDAYNVGNRANYDKVMAIVTDNFYSALKRASKGITLEKTTDTTQTVTKSEVKESDDDKRGWLNL